MSEPWFTSPGPTFSCEPQPEPAPRVEELEPEPPAETLTISGVTFEIGTDEILGDPTLSLTCAGNTHGPYIFSRTEIGALAAWLADHAEAGAR